MVILEGWVFLVSEVPLHPHLQKTFRYLTGHYWPERGRERERYIDEERERERGRERDLLEARFSQAGVG